MDQNRCTLNLVIISLRHVSIATSMVRLTRLFGLLLGLSQQKSCPSDLWRFYILATTLCFSISLHKALLGSILLFNIYHELLVLLFALLVSFHRKTELFDHFKCVFAMCQFCFMVHIVATFHRTRSKVALAVKLTLFKRSFVLMEAKANSFLLDMRLSNDR